MLDSVLDPMLIAAVSIGAWLVGRPWAGFNSPDSEFYASLALFGSDVADRSLDPAYTWTRLGYIAPVRALTSAFGAFAGFALWRLVLIAFVVGSVYCVVRLVGSRPLAVVLAAFTALNTVVMSFVGNTYLTGTLIAATCLLLALACWQAFGTPRFAWLPALLSGAVAAWLAMVNPYGMLLGLTMWCGVRVVTLVQVPDRRWRNLARDVGCAVLGFAVVFTGFIAAGLVIFPGRNWLSTYLDWNSRLDYATFIGDAHAWQHDIALLVPVLAVVLSAVALMRARAPRVAVVALVIAVANLAFTAAYLVAVPGPWLEAPTYVALLWPGALVASALAYSAIAAPATGPVRWGWAHAAVSAVAVALVLWAGRWDTDVAGIAALALAVAICVLALAANLRMRRPVTTGAAILALVAVSAFYLGAQVLQNGRGLVGSYGQFPFRAAYVDFDGDLLMSSKIAAEEFVLAHTSPGDRVAIWTDPDRMMAAVAAMQLWGWYNNVGSGSTLSESEAAALEQSRPSAIAMYAPEREQIDAFYASLPTWALPSPPECTTVPYLGVGNTHPSVCVTHLRWS